MRLQYSPEELGNKHKFISKFYQSQNTKRAALFSVLSEHFVACIPSIILEEETDLYPLAYFGQICMCYNRYLQMKKSSSDFYDIWSDKFIPDDLFSTYKSVDTWAVLSPKNFLYIYYDDDSNGAYDFLTQQVISQARKLDVETFSQINTQLKPYIDSMKADFPRFIEGYNKLTTQAMKF